MLTFILAMIAVYLTILYILNNEIKKEIRQELEDISSFIEDMPKSQTE
jgi:very-short-patch-repair endonuclease